MEKKNIKNSHQASHAISKPSDESRREILELYSNIGRVPVSKNQDFDLNPGVEKVSTEGLVKMLSSASPEIIVEALKGLAHQVEFAGLNLSKEIPLIGSILKLNPDPKVRFEAVRTLVKMRDEGMSELFLSVIDHDKSEKVREMAARALGYIKSEKSFPKLAYLLRDVWGQSIRVRAAAAFALGRLDPLRASGILIDSLINDPDDVVRKESAESLAVCLLKSNKDKTDVIVKTISSQINHEKEASLEVRIAVINAITVSECEACVDDLILALNRDPSGRVRGQAANALAHFFDPRIEKVLIESLNRETGGIKKRMALAVANYALKNPLGLHDEMCEALIKIQKLFPRESYIWKEAVKALPAC